MALLALGFCGLFFFFPGGGGGGGVVQVSWTSGHGAYRFLGLIQGSFQPSRASTQPSSRNPPQSQRPAYPTVPSMSRDFKQWQRSLPLIPRLLKLQPQVAFTALCVRGHALFGFTVFRFWGSYGYKGYGLQGLGGFGLQGFRLLSFRVRV